MDWAEACIYEFPLPWAGQAGSVGGEVRWTSVVFLALTPELVSGRVSWRVCDIVWHRDLE